MRKGIAFLAPHGMVVFSVAAACVLVGRLLAPAPLASFWPETAVLLAMFLRGPALCHPLGWLAAWFGLLAAGMLFDSDALKVGAEAAINLAGVFVAWQLLYTRDPLVPRLGSLRGFARVIAAVVLGGMSAAFLSALLEGALQGGQVLGPFALMWSAQVLGYVLLLPALLSLPPRGAILSVRMRRSDAHPLLAMAVAFVVAVAVGRAGVFLLPMLVLLWAGLVYGPMVMAWVSLLAGVVTLLLLPPEAPLPLWREVASRAIFALWLILPILLTILRRRGGLRWPLTARRAGGEGGALAARAAFRQAAQRLLDAHSYPLALLRVEMQMHNPAPEMQMLQRLTRALRKKDVVGQLTPRSFVLVLGNCPPPQARRVAARLLTSLQSDANFGPWFDLHFGIATLNEPVASLDQLLTLAEQALSHSKSAEEPVVMPWQGAQGPSWGKGVAGAPDISTRPP